MRARHDEAGATLVEFALILPLLLLLLVGILDVARGINAYVIMSSASEEGAHYAALRPTAAASAIASAVRARTVPLDPGQVAVSATYYDGATFQPWPSAGIPASSPQPRSIPVRVVVSYPWCSVTFFIGQLVSGGSCASGSTTTLESTSTMDTRR